MIDVREYVPLAPLTTLGVGGVARWYTDAASTDDVVGALQEAHRLGVGAPVLGGGSNTLVPDEGVEGLVIHPTIRGITHTYEDGEVLVVAGAGELWDDVVAYACAQGWWGIENLAAIPGTAGAAPVQNIGAYDAVLADTFAWVEGVHRTTRSVVRIHARDAAFGYRESVFKREGTWIITRVALRLSTQSAPRTSYKDFATVSTPLTTSLEVARAVRTIRADKMPPKGLGTAGSFFKNPFLTHEAFRSLRQRIPEVLGFETAEGVKVPLAWILDHVLQLRGASFGPVRLYEQQPLVLVAEDGATEKDVTACADEVTARVYRATGIRIEREVQTLNVQ